MYGRMWNLYAIVGATRHGSITLYYAFVGYGKDMPYCAEKSTRRSVAIFNFGYGRWKSYAIVTATRHGSVTPYYAF